MDSETPRRKKNSTDGNAERQRRYREHRKTHALELKGEVYSQLRAICQLKGWTIGQAVAEALILLQAKVAAEARSARTAEIYKQAVEEKRKSDEANLLRQPSKPRKPKPPVQPEDADGQGSLL